MNENLGKIMALIVDMENDNDFDISLEVEYDADEDMYYISHNIVDNGFDDETTLKINNKLIKYLDSNGIYNYGFGYSENMFGEEKRVNTKFPKKSGQAKFREQNFSVSMNSSKVTQMTLVA